MFPELRGDDPLVSPAHQQETDEQHGVIVILHTSPSLCCPPCVMHHQDVLGMRIDTPHSASALDSSSATSELMLRALHKERGEELCWQGQHKGSGCLFTSVFCLGPPHCVTSPPHRWLLLLLFQTGQLWRFRHPSTNPAAATG